MEKKPYVSARLKAQEEQYLDMRQALLGKIESELQAEREARILQFDDEKQAWEAAEKEYKEELETLKTVGMTAARIRAADKKDEALMKAYEAAVEPKLASMAGDRKADHRRKVAAARRFERLGGVQPTCIGADAVVSNNRFLGAAVDKGSLGNPGYWFYDPAEVAHPKVTHYGDSSSSGCAFWMIDFPEYAVISWQYMWDPGAHANGDVWNWLLAEVRYQGYFSLHSNDKWYNCKHAIVRATLDIDILQDDWMWKGAKERQLFYRKVRKGSASQTVSGSVVWDEMISLDPDQAALCAITLVIKCEAKGTSTFAKVNFLDAQPSYVGPPTLLIGT
ncbi:MAG: hypothetical protein LJE95_08585 [Acidobacteria bacterium]|nr:hypothetical protein [Acidobacteriota bacterium]